MNDAYGTCFTGRITRLVNSLNGFCPDIMIQINSTEQIGTIMEIVKRNLINKNKYSLELYRIELIKALEERDYEQKIIDEWLEYVVDE
jgi:hypothetical protein